jgi:hypothetical protein
MIVHIYFYINAFILGAVILNVSTQRSIDVFHIHMNTTCLTKKKAMYCDLGGHNKSYFKMIDTEMRRIKTLSQQINFLKTSSCVEIIHVHS